MGWAGHIARGKITDGPIGSKSGNQKQERDAGEGRTNSISAPQSKNAVSTNIKYSRLHPFNVKFLINPLPHLKVVCTYI